MSVKIVSQQNYYHELRENMEPKNMSGFCELTREDVKEIDGGHDRAHRNHNRLTGSRKSAASAQLLFLSLLHLQLSERFARAKCESMDINKNIGITGKIFAVITSSVDKMRL